MAQTPNSTSPPDQEENKDQPQAHPEKGGIYKLFDLMKMDLGTQQTEEIQNFYEKFSSQIKGLFQQQENGETC